MKAHQSFSFLQIVLSANAFIMVLAPTISRQLFLQNLKTEAKAVTVMHKIKKFDINGKATDCFFLDTIAYKIPVNKFH